jgi:hypothetical protein
MYRVQVCDNDGVIDKGTGLNLRETEVLFCKVVRRHQYVDIIHEASGTYLAGSAYGKVQHDNRFIAEKNTEVRDVPS